MRFWYNPNFLAICAIVILSIPALKSLAQVGFYTNHDGETHTARMAQYWQALVDGQIPPRIAGTLYNGLGSPILTYIYPLPYLAGSAVHSLGFSFTDSFEIVMALGFIFSGIFCYLWLKEVFQSQRAAFLGALFYVWAPYRFSLIYVRGSISENTAYTFLPLLFFCLTKLSQKRNLFWQASMSISTALFLLSQNLVALIMSPIISFYILYLAMVTKSFRFILVTGLSLLWGAAIASITYLPAIFERQFIRFDEVYALTYLDHFVNLKQLIHSPWGYGFSLTGFDDLMSFQIGLAHILIFGIFLAIVIIKIFSKKFFKNISKYFQNSTPRQILALSIFLASTVVIAVILMMPTDITIFTWQHAKPLARIDYPWRLLGITTFVLAFLASYVAKVAKPGLIFLLLALGVIIANRNHMRINLPATFDDNFFLNYNNTATQLGEFTPKWRQTTRVPIGFDPNIKVQVVSGQAQISNITASSKRITFQADITSPARVRINKFYFPNLQVLDNGQKLALGSNLVITEPGTLRLDKEQDASGLILVDLDHGHHEITAQYQETNLRFAANFLSLGSLVIALGVMAKYVKK